MQDPSRIWDFNHSSRQCQIINLPSKARNQTHIFMDAIVRFINWWTMMRTPFLNALIAVPCSHRKAWTRSVCSYAVWFSRAVCARVSHLVFCPSKSAFCLFVFGFLFFILFFYLFAFSRAALSAYGDSQARGRIEAIAAGLHQSHSNLGSRPHLRPTPQLTAVP